MTGTPCSPHSSFVEFMLPVVLNLALDATPDLAPPVGLDGEVRVRGLRAQGLVAGMDDLYPWGE